MSTQLDLAAYVASVRGKHIDVDGVFGAQCWDQWSHYAQWLGVPAGPTYTNAGGSSPHPGWACNVYHNAARSGLTQWFEILPASATPHAGDVVFMELGSAFYPNSHVATALDSPSKNGMLRCLTQNPGAVQIADLIMRGILGYLRPRALTVGALDTSKTPTLTASHKEEEMARNSGIYWDEGGNNWVYAVFNTMSGFWHEFSNGKGAMPADYNNALAGAMYTPSWAKVTKGHAAVIKEACTAVRTGK